MKRLLLSFIIYHLAFSVSATDTHKPWTFWYWMYGAVSEAGIKADLQAMKDVGLGGCYLMPIRGTEEAPSNLPQLGEDPAQQLSPHFWQLVDYAMQQADSLGLQLGFHICDGFALAGGPWITPAESMQKIVSTQTLITGGIGKCDSLMQPAGYEGYYEDIACFAIPSESGKLCANPATPVITFSPSVTRDEKGTFRASEPGWIQYEYPGTVTFRSVEIIPSGNNIQSQRLKMLVSSDGEKFTLVKQFEPARQGWQDQGYGFTYAIPKTSGRYFRFEWTPEGTEPGSEDLDAAKWKPVLKLKDIRMSDQLRINQWEGKSGLLWRLAPETTEEEIPDKDCVKLKAIRRIELKDGRLAEPLPKGDWLVIRIGHTSTGYTNATAGGGKGLECDKFSETAVKKQVSQWFGKFMERPHSSVIKYMHVDSWECSSQNWSNNFAEEFQKRRGYDLIPWLPVMVGIPLESAAKSEQVLRDVRQTIDELKNEVFFKTVCDYAHAYGVQLSVECVAPTMMSDGMSHYRYADIPMGEYWLNSPTHDKPNDMLDAISGAHIYGKNIVQAEGFTEVRGVWDETPASIKGLLDRNFALGMNRLFFHVTAHNPWLDRKPGMTLDGIGLFFQRDQTWFAEAKGLVDYVTRCQTLLQQGKPVVDIAVYTGEEMPRRALTPDRVVSMLPGLFGPERLTAEQKRLANVGQPMEESPVGVNHSAGILDMKDWINPLHGYQYDSMNKDALLNMPFHYKVLVIPEGCLVSDEVRTRIEALCQQGVVIIDEPYDESTFNGLCPDVQLPSGIAFCHRRDGAKDIYFLSNQREEEQRFTATFRCGTKNVMFFDPLKNRHFIDVNDVVSSDSLTTLNVRMQPKQALFVLFGEDSIRPHVTARWHVPMIGPDMPQTVFKWKTDGWQLLFEENGEKIKSDTLFSWADHQKDAVRYYSGHVRYSTTLRYHGENVRDRVVLDLGDVRDIAHVWLNGRDLGIVWMPPFSVDVDGYLREGENELVVEVVNTWHNALRGADRGIPPYDGIWTNAKHRTKGDGLLPAGLLGPVKLRIEN